MRSPWVHDADISSKQLRCLADLVEKNPFRRRAEMREDRRRVDGDDSAVAYGAISSIWRQLGHVGEKPCNQAPGITVHLNQRGVVREAKIL